jgi:hypothetical protein
VLRGLVNGTLTVLLRTCPAADPIEGAFAMPSTRQSAVDRVAAARNHQHPVGEAASKREGSRRKNFRKSMQGASRSAAPLFELARRSK